MEPTVPFWFRQRQGKMEPAGPDTFKLTAPNIAEALITIRQTGNGRWRSALQLQSEGPVVEAAPVDLESASEAWEAAFELYRRRMVV
jgi:hypothetical protein